MGNAGITNPFARAGLRKRRIEFQQSQECVRASQKDDHNRVVLYAGNGRKLLIVDTLDSTNLDQPGGTAIETDSIVQFEYREPGMVYPADHLAAADVLFN